ncbi:hypothetical protein F8E02_04045 [Methanoculleus sp. Wushi-C6]|uniref:Glycosyltransferase RgtA/B/C/D-like domain-containing protein n=1 Tax=Methanoculleus caldifontis TaxID=2651577 RepID=A0ABU3WZG6_9EURY|nr:hypothetical protein [Methanoculleus sp. Wushi-C6]MDV2481193.1 hypothetical protein [Methanoculleus sp. Wushi-C6]
MGIKNVFGETTVRTYLSWFTDNIDVIGSVAGILIGVAISLLYLISKTIYLPMLGLALFSASLIYLLLRRANVKEYPISRSRGLSVLYEILFFSGITACLALLHTSGCRPPTYFIIFGVCAGLLALSILCVKTKHGVLLQLFKIVILSLLSKYSVYWFSGGSGVDYWIHLSMNLLLAQDGNISVLINKEEFFPLMHIQVAIGQILTAVPIRDASNYFILLPYVLAAICVFIIGRKIFNEKVGLLAMLIVSITDFHFLWGIAPQTTTYGVTLFYFLILIVFEATNGNDRPKWIFLSVILILTLILGHAVSSFIMLTTLIALYIGSYLYNTVFREKQIFSFCPYLFLLYVVVLIQHWVVAVYGRENSFFDMIIVTFENSVSEYAGFLNRPETSAKYVVMMPSIFEQAADTAGLALLLFFTAIAGYLWVSRRYRNGYTVSIVVCVIILMSITFGFPLFGIRNILPTRWFVFLYLFIAIMAACAIVKLQYALPKRHMAIAFVFASVFIMAFFMSACTTANQDSPLWLKESTISTRYTFQEVYGAQKLSFLSDKFMADSNYMCLLSMDPGNHVREFTSKKLFSDADRIFVWRNYMYDRPIRQEIELEGYYKRIGISQIVGLEMLNNLEVKSKVYQNADITGFYL